MKMDEKGSVALEFSLIYSMLLALLLSIFHFGLFYHVNLAVSDAADVGLDMFQSGSSIAGAEAAVKELVGSDPLLRNLKMSAEVDGNMAFVTISAESPRILWGLPNHAKRQVSGPLEQFLHEGER